MAPSGFKTPTLINVDMTSMTLQWSSPSSNGGCTIKSYHIFMNDGDGLNNFHEVDAATVAGIPSLRTYQVLFTAADTSKTYKFYLITENIVGTVSTDVISFILAATPSQPPSPPTLNLGDTKSYQIQVDYVALASSLNGGSDILSYELQVYNYTMSSWISIIGGEDNFSLQNTYTYGKGISKGKSYQFRYRAWNINGAGAFSDVAYITAAQVPARPPAPVYSSSTAISITLTLLQSVDDGGSMITSYVLEISPYLSTSWSTVASYDGSSMTHTITTVSGEITSYTKYRFRFQAVNSYGNSDYSEELQAVIAPLPSQPAPVTKDQIYSTKTSIKIKWY